MRKYRDAIAAIESRGSGDYGARGPQTGGDRAYGRYQVMGKNIPSWTKEALGYSMTPEEFLASPEAQDAVFDNKFGGYINKYGEEGAAQAWFGGPGSVGKGGRQDVLGTSVNSYGQKFMRNIGQAPGAPSGASNPAPQSGFTPTGQPLPQEAAPFQNAGGAPKLSAPTAKSTAGFLSALGEAMVSSAQAEPRMSEPALNSIAQKASAGPQIDTSDPLGLQSGGNGGAASPAAPMSMPAAAGAPMSAPPSGAPQGTPAGVDFKQLIDTMEKLKSAAPQSEPLWEVGKDGEVKPRTGLRDALKMKPTGYLQGGEGTPYHTPTSPRAPEQGPPMPADPVSSVIPSPQAGSLQSQIAPIGADPFANRFDKMTAMPERGTQTGGLLSVPALPNEDRFDKMNPFGSPATQGLPNEDRFDKMNPFVKSPQGPANEDRFDKMQSIPDSFKLPDTAPIPEAKPTKKPFDTMGFLSALGGVMSALDQGSPEVRPVSLSGVRHDANFNGLPMRQGLLSLMGLGG